MDVDKIIIALFGAAGVLLGAIITSLFGLLKSYLEDRMAWKNNLREHIKEDTILNGLIPLLKFLESTYDMVLNENVTAFKDAKIPKSLFKRFDSRYQTDWLTSVSYIEKVLDKAATTNTNPPETLITVVDQLYEEVYYYYNIQLNNPFLSWRKRWFSRIWAYLLFGGKRKVARAIIGKG